MILEKFDGKKIAGKPQVGLETFYERRIPENNEIKIENFINHLRGCEKNHPGFFYYKGEKFFVFVEPERKPNFPSDIEIKFLA